MWSILVTHPMTVPHSGRITVVAKPLRSHNHCRNNPSVESFSATLTLACGHSTRIVEDRTPRWWKNLQQQVSHSLPRTWLPLRSPNFITLLAADLQAYALGFLIQQLHHPRLSIFLFGGIYFQLLLDFSSKSDTIEVPLTIWSCFVPYESTFSFDSATLY